MDKLDSSEILAASFLGFLQGILDFSITIPVYHLNPDDYQRYWEEVEGNIADILDILDSFMPIEPAILASPKREEYLRLQREVDDRLSGYLHFIDHVIMGGSGESLIPEIDEDTIVLGPSVPFEM